MPLKTELRSSTTLTSSPFMSAREVAAYFGRTTRTIFNWEAQGLLKPHRMGRSKFYLRADIESFANAGTRPDPDAIPDNGNDENHHEKISTRN